MTPQKKEEQKSSEDREDIRVLYKALLDDIKLYKNQQWLTTYYIFGIYFALTSILFQLKKEIICADNYFLIIPSFLVMIAGITLLCINNKDLQKARAHKDKVIAESEVFSRILNPYDKENKDRKKVHNNKNKDFSLLIYWTLMLAVIIGGLLLVYLILRSFLV